MQLNDESGVINESAGGAGEPRSLGGDAAVDKSPAALPTNSVGRGVSLRRRAGAILRAFVEASAYKSDESVLSGTAAGGAYTVRVSFTARDSSGGPVWCLVAARSSILLAATYRTARPSLSSVVLTLRPRAAERSFRVEIDATDQVGNERIVERVRSLRGAS